MNNQIKNPNFDLSKLCQSCSVPMKSDMMGDIRGTEKDGTHSEVYCRNCYINGDFVFKGTLDEFVQKARDAIAINPMMPEQMKQQILVAFDNGTYRAALANLRRWRISN